MERESQRNAKELVLLLFSVLAAFTYSGVPLACLIGAVLTLLSMIFDELREL